MQQGQAAQPVGPPPPPFQLTQQEQAQVDQVLKKWEQMSKEIKTYDSKFVIWEYDLNFPIRDPKAPPGAQLQPNYTDQGILKYAMPDKGIYRITAYGGERPMGSGPAGAGRFTGSATARRSMSTNIRPRRQSRGRTASRNRDKSSSIPCRRNAGQGDRRRSAAVSVRRGGR